MKIINKSDKKYGGRVHLVKYFSSTENSTCESKSSNIQEERK